MFMFFCNGKLFSAYYFSWQLNIPRSPKSNSRVLEVLKRTKKIQNSNLSTKTISSFCSEWWMIQKRYYNILVILHHPIQTTQFTAHRSLNSNNRFPPDHTFPSQCRNKRTHVGDAFGMRVGGVWSKTADERGSSSSWGLTDARISFVRAGWKTGCYACTWIRRIYRGVCAAIWGWSARLGSTQYSVRPQKSPAPRMVHSAINNAHRVRRMTPTVALLTRGCGAN